MLSICNHVHHASHSTIDVWTHKLNAPGSSSGRILTVSFRQEAMGNTNGREMDVVQADRFHAQEYPMYKEEDDDYEVANDQVTETRRWFRTRKVRSVVARKTRGRSKFMAPSKKIPWETRELKTTLIAVKTVGLGKWKPILQAYPEMFGKKNNRTAVKIKDVYDTMVKKRLAR